MTLPSTDSRVTRLEAALLAVLAMAHPRRVEAIDAFTALWQIKFIPTPDLESGMTMLIMAMTALENLGYGRSQLEGEIAWYSLTDAGVRTLMSDLDITDALGFYGMMGADRLAGGRPN
jgi:hypothetical protein